MKKLVAVLFSCIFSIITFAQQDSCNLHISLLTCGPGEDLYSVFGHSALRVTDRNKNTDIIFNYGTFDFEDPDFYAKFVRGKLLYYVSIERFGDFMRAYQAENRYVIEQPLTLSCNEIQNLYQALQLNAQEQNKYYLYEFLFDNCSTRLRDIVAANSEDSVHYKRIIPARAPTFRNMLHDYLDRGNQHWSKFGIDLLLGSRIDRQVRNEEAMFLPDYLMKGFDSTIVENRALVQSKKLILPGAEKTDEGFKITPLMVTIALLVIGIIITFVKSPKLVSFRNTFDIAYFLILGLMGCLMLFMWYGTDHELCRNNYNLYWAIPSHVVAAFFVTGDRPITRKYFTITAILNLVFVASWAFLPQGMNSAFLPLVLLSGIRSFHRLIKK